MPGSATRWIRPWGAAGAAFVASIVLVLGAGAPTLGPAAPHVQAAGRAQSDVDWSAVEQALGRAGTIMPGNVYRVAMPRSDLSVVVEGVPVEANFALGSYAAFKPMDDGGGMAMVMSDLVLKDEEVPAVLSGLFDNGLQVTALHNHVNQVTPHVMYLHDEGMGDPVQLASGLHAALGASSTPLGPTAPAQPSTGPQLDLDMLQGVLGAYGHSRRQRGGAVRHPAGGDHHRERHHAPTSHGHGHRVNFQPTDGGKAAITGDFVLIADEINPVASALRASGIEVTALHNHALGDQPRLFYMHFWANDDPQKLATALRARSI